MDVILDLLDAVPDLLAEAGRFLELRFLRITLKSLVRALEGRTTFGLRLTNSLSSSSRGGRPAIYKNVFSM